MWVFLCFAVGPDVERSASYSNPFFPSLYRSGIRYFAVKDLFR
jgi:hypothetical protein